MKALDYIKLSTITLVALIIIMQGFGPYKVTYNRTKSIMTGWYWVDTTRVDQRLGALVWARSQKAQSMGCIESHQYLLKHIVGLPGQTICLDQGRLLTPAYAPYSIGPKTLPYAFDGCIELGHDEVFLATPHPKSCDSRVLGPILIKDLLGTATKL